MTVVVVSLASVAFPKPGGRYATPVPGPTDRYRRGHGALRRDPRRAAVAGRDGGALAYVVLAVGRAGCGHGTSGGSQSTRPGEHRCPRPSRRSEERRGGRERKTTL